MLLLMGGLALKDGRRGSRVDDTERRSPHRKVRQGKRVKFDAQRMLRILQ